MNLLAWGTWLGATMYTTFVLGIALFKALPRQTFRDVQEVAFPAFFALSAACVLLQLALAPALAPAATPLLAGALAAVLVNQLALEPRTSAVMKERAALEKMSSPIASGVYPQGKEAAMKALSARFGALHGASSAANLAALCCAIVYGWRHLLL